MDGRDSKKWRRLIIEKNYEPVKTVLELYKGKGIMAIRDGGDNHGISLVAREIANYLGITFRSPGWAVYKKGMYGNFLGRPVVGIDDFKDMFKELLKIKVDHLKIILTGLVDFEHYGRVGDIGFSMEELKYMVQSAKDKGLPVMVHANSPAGVRMAIEAGADTIEHGYFLEDEELHMMREKCVTWIPTLAPLGNILYSKELQGLYNDKIENIKKIFSGHLKAIKKALSLGVKVAIGSDSGSLGVYHAQGFFDEVRYFKKCGICEEDVYKMAYENGIKVVGLA